MTLRVVATDNRVGHSEYGINGSSTCRGDYFPIVIGSGDVSGFYLYFDNWFRAGGNEVSATNSYSVTCSVQSGSVSAPVAFSGARNFTINPGDSQIASDLITPAAFGLTKFTKGDLYWYKGIRTYPTGGAAALENGFEASGTSFPGYPGSVCADYNPATASIGSVDTLGGFVGSGSGIALQVQGYRPHVIGTFVSGDPLTLGGIIDSINATGNGAYEYVGSGASTSAGNPLQGGLGRVAAQTVVGGPIAYINLSKNSGTAETHTKTAAYFKFFRVLLDELGANDLSAPSTINPRELDIWASARSQGVEKIVRTHLFPRTNSSDGFQTSSGQSYQTTDFSAAGNGGLFNAWMDARLADGTIDAVLPLNGLRDPSDPYKWNFDGTSGKFTGDGTHPTAYATVTFAAADLVAYLNTLPFASGSGSAPAPAPAPTGGSLWAARVGEFVVTSDGYVVPLI